MREIARNQRSEVVIHGRDAKIRDRDSYGNDPFPRGMPAIREEAILAGGGADPARAAAADVWLRWRVMVSDTEAPSAAADERRVQFGNAREDGDVLTAAAPDAGAPGCTATATRRTRKE